MLDTLKRYMRYTSWPIIAAMLLLMAIGIQAITVSEQADPQMKGYAAKQLAFALVGLAVFVAVTAVPYQVYGRLAYPLFAATLVLLVVVMFLPASKGSHRWVDLGAIKIQVSEIA